MILKRYKTLMKLCDAQEIKCYYTAGHYILGFDKIEHKYCIAHFKHSEYSGYTLDNFTTYDSKEQALNVLYKRIKLTKIKDK